MAERAMKAVPADQTSGKQKATTFDDLFGNLFQTEQPTLGAEAAQLPAGAREPTSDTSVIEPGIIGAAAVLPLAAPEPEAEPITYEPHTSGPVLSHDERAEYTTGAGMSRDEEIEAVGMQVTMDYEHEYGWRPEDVSGENHGFDVHSTCYDDDGSFADVRYIEVKARARSGAIRLSANEWKKARHFGDKFWLYIVTQAATDAPQLHPIQNPAAHFRMDEDIFAMGFIVPEERWRGRTGAHRAHIALRHTLILLSRA
jgi:hypothetical protein